MKRQAKITERKIPEKRPQSWASPSTKSLQTRVFTDNRALQVQQQKIQALVSNSPQSIKMRQQQTIMQANPAQVLQKKLLRHDNPHLGASGVVTPVTGAAEVLAAAKTIDAGTETGRDDVTTWMSAYQKGTKTSDQVKAYFTGKASSGHVRNFVNRLIDWGKTGSPGLLKANAGYIIEGYAEREADSIGASSQVVIGGSRPDFGIDTKKTWQSNGKQYAANGFVDATSHTEAAKGHISSKMVPVKPQDAFHYPHLYDSYYEDLVLDGSKPTVSVLEELSDAYQARQEEMRARVLRAKRRRRSLRSAKPKRAGGKMKATRRKNDRYRPY